MGDQVRQKVFNKSSFFEDPDVASTIAVYKNDDELERPDEWELDKNEIEEFKEG